MTQSFNEYLGQRKSQFIQSTWISLPIFMILGFLVFLVGHLLIALIRPDLVHSVSFITLLFGSVVGGLGGWFVIKSEIKKTESELYRLESLNSFAKKNLEAADLLYKNDVFSKEEHRKIVNKIESNIKNLKHN